MKIRTYSRRALLFGAAGVLGFTAAARAQARKMAKSKVAYQDTPKDGRQCARCAHYIARDRACRLVEGEIAPQGWCSLWTPG